MGQSIPPLVSLATQLDSYRWLKPVIDCIVTYAKLITSSKEVISVVSYYDMHDHFRKHR